MTGAELCGAVGSLMDIGTPGSGTTPTATEIYSFLNLAQKMIAKNAPDDDLKELLGTYEHTATGTETVIPCAATADGSAHVPIMRVVSVKAGADGSEFPCAFRSRFVFDQEVTSTNFDTDKRIWTYAVPQDFVDNDPASDTPKVTKIEIYPAVSSGQKVEIQYIEVPASISSSVGTDSESNGTLNSGYDDVLILYATAMSKVQDEEMADAQYLLQVAGVTMGRTGNPVPPKGE